MNIPDNIKSLFKQDNAQKTIKLYFPEIDLTINHDKIVTESMEIAEAICPDKDLKFGVCVASSFSIVVADITQDIKGKILEVSMTIGEYELSLGKYVVNSALQQSNLRYKKIVAYDNIKKFDIDVASWYNSLTFPLTLSAFRASFLTYIGLTQDTSTLPLPNDSMTITKTIEPASISGRVVIEAIEEINGVFGRIGRDGKFKHVILKPTYGMYPSAGLYPSANLYPVSESNTSYVQGNLIDETITEEMRETIRFEEYTVKEIDKLIIRTDADDVGAIAGTGTNAYIIQGNFLVYGKTAAELQTIATNAFGYMAKRPYRPYESENIGLPYLEPGDMLKFDQADPVVGYMLNRTLKGIQSLKDSYGASGGQEREQRTDVNTEIKILQAKTLRIKKDVEGVRVEVSDLAENTSASLEIVSNAIIQKVSKDSIIQSINLSTEGLQIDVTKLNITGLVTISSLNTPGSVVIDGGNLKAGTVIADTVRAGWVYAGNISANQITAGTFTGDRISGGTISGVTFVSSSPGIGSLEINGSYLRGKDSLGNTKMDIYPGGIDVTGNINCNTINGYGPVTEGNIGSKSVSHADSAGNAFTSDISYSLYSSGLSKRVYVSADDNFRPGSSLQGSCGSSLGLWTAVYAQSGTIQTSDRRKKTDIASLSEKYILFAKKLLTLPRTFRMIDGQSGRTHVGFIAQDVEDAMTECGITDMDFAGLIKSPVYSRKLVDEEGAEIDEYDTTSEIIDYSYGLRDSEFVPLLFALYADLVKI